MCIRDSSQTGWSEWSHIHHHQRYLARILFLSWRRSHDMVQRSRWNYLFSLGICPPKTVSSIYRIDHRQWSPLRITSTAQQPFNSSLKFANLGRCIVEEFILLYEGWHIKMWRQNAFERYLNLLEEYPEVIGAIPLKYVASYLGITVQSLSRIRAGLKRW